MLGLDTTVVVRLLVGEPARQADAARERLGKAKEPVAISDLVVSEAYFALRHHYRVPHAAAIESLRALLADPRVHPTGVAAAVLSQLPREDTVPALMDRLIHADYASGDVALLTFDRDAARLSGAQLIAS